MPAETIAHSATQSAVCNEVVQACVREQSSMGRSAFQLRGCALAFDAFFDLKLEANVRRAYELRTAADTPAVRTSDTADRAAHRESKSAPRKTLAGTSSSASASTGSEPRCKSTPQLLASSDLSVQPRRFSTIVHPHSLRSSLADASFARSDASGTTAWEFARNLAAVRQALTGQAARSAFILFGSLENHFKMGAMLWAAAEDTRMEDVRPRFGCLSFRMPLAGCARSHRR